MSNDKLQTNLKKLQAYAKNLEAAKRAHVAVGLPVENIGGKIYGDGVTVAQVGGAHEYGATINHPGGTPYVIGDDGLAAFVPKGTDNVAGVTKPHTINLPQRSFLRVPFAIKSDEINKFISDQFGKILTNGQSAGRALEFIGIKARNIAVGAFTSQGYGTWPALKPATIKAKGSSQVLIDNGILRGSISYAVRGLDA